MTMIIVAVRLVSITAVCYYSLSDHARNYSHFVYSVFILIRAYFSNEFLPENTLKIFFLVFPFEMEFNIIRELIQPYPTLELGMPMSLIHALCKDKQTDWNVKVYETPHSKTYS